VLAGCDSQHTLRTLIADVAHGLGVDFDTVAPACLEVVRKLLHMGFLSMVGLERSKSSRSSLGSE
jgi:hypothetical protein